MESNWINIGLFIVTGLVVFGYITWIGVRVMLSTRRAKARRILKRKQIKEVEKVSVDLITEVEKIKAEIETKEAFAKVETSKPKSLASVQEFFRVPYVKSTDPLFYFSDIDFIRESLKKDIYTNFEIALLSVTKAVESIGDKAAERKLYDIQFEYFKKIHEILHEKGEFEPKE